MQVVNLKQKLSQFDDLWSPRVVAALNDYQFKLAKLQGEFVWHAHEETDEAFLVLEGNLRIEFRDGHVDLVAGELYVVPRGVEHRPVAENEAHVLLVEPSATKNTGDASVSELTAENDVWIEGSS